MSQEAGVQIYRLMEPWAVLAAGALITSCASKNFSALDLLRAPVQIQGRIDGKAAVTAVPKWFPIDESYFESQAGLIYSRVKDLAVPRRTQVVGEAVQVGFDVSKVALPPDIGSFTLTYFPWFRFMSEPISFDAAGKVASYIANCLHFLLRSKGFSAMLQSAGDLFSVVTDHGITLEISGMAALNRLSVVGDGVISTFDLAGRRIELAEDMFPAAFEAGRAMLQTPDRLLNIETVVDNKCLVLAYREESQYVQT